MPTLPSGRRVEFSLDRFHVYLKQIPTSYAQEIVASFEDSDDLLFVMDAVHFGLDDEPFFAGYVAVDWQSYARDWSMADLQALQEWLISMEARDARAEAVEYIRAMHGSTRGGGRTFPYLLAGEYGRKRAGSVSCLRH